ncbi:hypothetical protein PG989_002909 [Apiospora arundinis]
MQRAHPRWPTPRQALTVALPPPRPNVLLPSSCDGPMPNTPRRQLVWIVFGGTGHMGRSLVKCALSRGDLVTAVGRTFETSPEAMAQQHPGPNSLGLLCDVRARDSVARVIERTQQHFGRVDVVANCSGYGVIGACEDQDDHEIRNQFETNFMGTLHIIQASLPYFREQRGGRYLIFSSTSGALGVPGLGPYCATKYAVEGLIEAMLYEIDSFGIKATLVEPGLVRRDEPADDQEGGATVAGSGAAAAPLPLPTWGHFLIKPASEPYAHPASPALHAKRMVQWLGDKQPTSAVKCAELVWQLGHCAYPPLRLVLGSYAIESIRDRLRSVTEELEDWKHLHHAPPPEVLEAAAAAAAAAEASDKQRRGESVGSGSGPQQQQPQSQQQQDKEKGPEVKAEGGDEDEEMAGESGGEMQDQIMVIT